jgi:hypothetical protein
MRPFWVWKTFSFVIPTQLVDDQWNPYTHDLTNNVQSWGTHIMLHTYN